MAVVTISRQLGSLGTEISRELQRDLEWKFLDKESLEERFAVYGVPLESVQKYDEKRPSFWENFSSEKDRYLHFMTKAVYEVASQGNCIILGRGGQALLTALPGTLHIRIIAPLEARLNRIMNRFQCDKVHAEKMLRQSDHNRAGFHKFFFDVNWESCDLYDLVVNTSSLSVKASVSLIRSFIDTVGIKKSLNDTLRKLTHLKLGLDVITTITYKKNIPIHFLEAIAEDDVVTLRGSAMSMDDIKRSEAAAGSVPGVSEVINDIQFVPLTFGMT